VTSGGGGFVSLRPRPAIMRVRSMRPGKVVWNPEGLNEQRTIAAAGTRASKGAEQVRWAIDLTSPMARCCRSQCWCARTSVSSTVPGDGNT